MTDILHRYPGAQPFRDDEVSRRTFFGREQASIALTDQILANRLVIVYAKSGLGKTSLLNAGVAPRLREAGSLPLLVRANDIQRGPLFSVLEGIRAEATRQQVEYVEGDSSSLWNFFKSVEFWRGDLLLTPVLILDQFEELFTLQSPEARETFLSDLGYLVRGIPPPSQQKIEANVSETPPAIRVALSLREDFLGMIEEASDRIPEIMDHRFRVTPLSYEMATKAITGPAAIEDRNIATKAFRLEPEFVTSILDYLTKSTAGAHGAAGRYVEPFHLQLICQRIEKVAAYRQQLSGGGEVVLSFKDLGGDAALAETLESFYLAAIRSLPVRHLRGAARILCEQFLISPEGRRLSVEERELRRQLKLPAETLSHLVERRLLRTDRRSDSTYYELSHDALVQPVLASRRMQALVVSWAAVLAGSIVSLVAVLTIVVCIAAVIVGLVDKTLTGAQCLGLFIFVVVAAFIGVLGLAWLRAGLRRRKRYRPHTEREFTQSLPTLLPLRDRILGWSMLLTGPAFLIMWGLGGLYDLLIYGTVSFTHGKAPQWLAWARGDMHEAWQLMHDHPFVEMLWVVFEYSAIVIFGWLLLRQGARKLWPHKFAGRSQAPVPGIDQPPSLALASLKALSAIIALIGSVLGFFTLRRCASLWHGSIPHWLDVTIVSYRLSDACQTFYQKSWDWNAISFALFFFSLFVFSIALLRDGILDMRTALHHHQLAPVAVCGILILGAIVWAWPRSSSKQGQKLQAQAAMSKLLSDTHPSGWAVGNNATILHTEDGGSTWKAQNTGRGWFYSVTFPTRQSGWAVGPQGTIWHTDNGGATWKLQKSDTVKDLAGISYATPQSAWVVGNKGTILHTEDGGGTWKRQNSGTRADMLEITFLTPQVGWAVGHGGIVLHTEDGGETWSQQNSGTNSDLQSVAFATPHGIIGAHVQSVSKGVVIRSIAPNGPAFEAGLQLGDIIVSVNGKPVKNTDELVTAISAQKPGTDATVDYIRNGKGSIANLTIADDSKPFTKQAER
jgi:hypothetical protein